MQSRSSYWLKYEPVRNDQQGRSGRSYHLAADRVHSMRTTLCLACLFAVAMIGCGSSRSSQDPSTTALAQSGRALAVDLDAGRYESACQDLTVIERHMLGQEIASVATKLKGAGEAEMLAREMMSGKPRGCVGFLAFAETLAHATNANTSLGEQFDRRLSHLLPTVHVRGDAATDHGVVEARYEGGRWRFEGHGHQPPFEVPTINSDGQRFFPPE